MVNKAVKKILFENDLKFVVHLFIEGLLLILFPFSIFFRVFLSPKYNDYKNNKGTPVVIVGQWFTHNALHLLMKGFLEKRGHPVYLYNYSIMKGGIDDGAIELKKFIENKKISKCILVGISTGAVTSYVYAQKFNGWRHVLKIISVGGPFFGTPWALFYSFSKTGRDLMPDSKFMRELHKIRNKHPEKIVSVIPVFDEFISKSSSILPNSRVKKIDVAGHNNLHIWSPDVFYIILNEAAI